MVEQAIRGGPIPGAAAAAGSRGAHADRYFGHLEPAGAPVDDGTFYDLASLTKVLCTAPLLLRLVARGQIDPHSPLRDILPETAWMQERPSLADVRVVDLAGHAGGLPAWQPLYTLGLDRQTHFARLLHTPLTGTRGTAVYSDLGAMLLGHVLERVVGEPLDRQAQALYAPLGLAADLTFQPAAPRTAPTEQCPWRGRWLRAEVHDENAAALGGVSAHAGLFGTLRGVVGYAHALLDGRLHPPAVLEYLSREIARTQDGERRGFLWALASPGWSGGDLVSPRTVGHTGFTGTGLWIDLDRGRYSALLTNRVYPSRHVASGIVALRRAFNHAAHAV